MGVVGHDDEGRRGGGNLAGVIEFYPFSQGFQHLGGVLVDDGFQRIVDLGRRYAHDILLVQLLHHGHDLGNSLVVQTGDEHDGNEGGIGDFVTNRRLVFARRVLLLVGDEIPFVDQNEHRPAIFNGERNQSGILIIKPLLGIDDDKNDIGIFDGSKAEHGA